MFEFPLSLPALPDCPIAEAPRPSQRLLRQAEREIECRHYEAAVVTLQRAIGLGADPYACTLRIADIECRRQRWQCALGAAEQAATLAPDRPTAYEVLMIVALQAGDYDRAIAASQALIKRDPRHLAAHDVLGTTYIQMGDVEAAMRVLNTLIRLNPTDPAHHFKKGLLCQHQGEVALAVHAFTQALRLEPAGEQAEAAREALESLDAYQLNQILTLAMEDGVFRIKLLRDAVGAIEERGFALSAHGEQILTELCVQFLPDTLDLARSLRYN